MSKFVSTAGLFGSSTAILAAAIFVAGAAAQTAGPIPDLSSNGAGWQFLNGVDGSVAQVRDQLIDGLVVLRQLGFPGRAFCRVAGLFHFEFCDTIGLGTLMRVLRGLAARGKLHLLDTPGGNLLGVDLLGCGDSLRVLLPFE